MRRTHDKTSDDFLMLVRRNRTDPGACGRGITRKAWCRASDRTRPRARAELPAPLARAEPPHLVLAWRSCIATMLHARRSRTATILRARCECGPDRMRQAHGARRADATPAPTAKSRCG